MGYLLQRLHPVIQCKETEQTRILKPKQQALTIFFEYIATSLLSYPQRDGIKLIQTVLVCRAQPILTKRPPARSLQTILQTTRQWGALCFYHLPSLTKYSTAAVIKNIFFRPPVYHDSNFKLEITDKSPAKPNFLDIPGRPNQ